MREIDQPLRRRTFVAALAGSTALSQEVELTARTQWQSAAGRDLFLSTYTPGTGLRLAPGDPVRLRFHNRLRETTNLHFHGLHVSPGGNADNAFREVPPGESAGYEFDLPSGHPGGTYWIHPHHHGMVAHQLAQGLALPLIVEGLLDQIPEIARAPERILLLQDFDVNARGVPVEPSMMERMQGREGPLILVRGEKTPAFPLENNGWLRLRIINASPSRFYRLAIDEHPLFQIASDGGALPGVLGLDELLLAPGERAEVMVRGAREPGVYRLWNLPYDRGGMRFGSSAGPAEVIGLLRYQGEAESAWELPDRLATIDPRPAPERSRTFVLGQGGMMGFTINGRLFDARRVDTVVKLGSVEDWEFVNPNPMDHPMHVHTNPFQVLDAAGEPVRAWKDVVVVPAYGRVRVRMRFEDFVGSTFYHCHILDHEDLGMMGRLEIT